MTERHSRKLHCTECGKPAFRVKDHFNVDRGDLVSGFMFLNLDYTKITTPDVNCPNCGYVVPIMTENIL